MSDEREVTFLRDLRYDTNPRLEAAWLQDWDARPLKLEPSGVLYDVYGYFACFCLGFIIGAMIVLLSVGR